MWQGGASPPELAINNDEDAKRNVAIPDTGRRIAPSPSPRSTKG